MPSGADAKHRQPAKAINAEAQKKKWEETRRMKDSEKYHKAEVERNLISISSDKTVRLRGN